jgi:GTP cyclohydrolase II
MPPSTIVPLPRTPALLVRHAARALRAGRAATLKGASGAVRAAAAEQVPPPGDGAVPPPWAASSGAFLALTGQRLAGLGVAGVGEAAGTVWRVPVGPEVPPQAVAAMADPTATPDPALRALAARATPGDELAAGAVELCKLAGLLPAAVCLPPSRHPAAGEVALLLGAVREYRRLEALGLVPVSEARVPLADAEDAHLVAFRPADGGPEQFAILVGEPEAEEAPLVRMHSECFTGDLLGSLRCDCGDQLRGAIRRMAEEGSGVLLYLAQEGRGIGLANKLRAYALQDGGLDTVDANTRLGFEPDERRYWAAATMLRHLGIGRVRLLTNNPAKLEQLAAYGIEVAGRVPHAFGANAHNQGYLLTKARRSGHLLDVDALEDAPAPRRAVAGRG